LSFSPLVTSVLTAVFNINLIVDCLDGGVFLCRCHRGCGGVWKTPFSYTSATYVRHSVVLVQVTYSKAKQKIQPEAAKPKLLARL